MNFNILDLLKFKNYNKPKVLIFGAGNYGLKVQSLIHKNCTIVGFIDNDSNKYGIELNNIKIYSPKSINSIKHDFIVIASMYEKEIFEQLGTVISDPKKIVLSSMYVDINSFSFPWESIVLAFVIFSFIALILTYIFIF
jgi:FlaA1/EpsC-like NDP-sugar epimerase